MRILKTTVTLFIIIIYSNAEIHSQTNIKTSKATPSEKPGKDYLHWGIEYGAQGEFELAMKLFEKALSLDSVNQYAIRGINLITDISEQKINKETGIHLFKGTQLRAKKKYDEAIDEYNIAIKMSPEYPDSYCERGTTFARQKEYEKAISDFKTAIEVNPYFADGYNNLGVVYNIQGQYEEAIKEFTKAIETDSLHIIAYLNRGQIYLNELADYNSGLADYQKACELGECERYNSLLKSVDDNNDSNENNRRPKPIGGDEEVRSVFQSELGSTYDELLGIQVEFSLALHPDGYILQIISVIGIKDNKLIEGRIVYQLKKIMLENIRFTPANKDRKNGVRIFNYYFTF